MDHPASATYYVRLSLMEPKHGEREHVLELHRNLVAWLAGQPGFVSGFVIEGGDPADRVGHLNIYRTEEDAEHAANTSHVLSTRAELLLLIDEDTHAEHSYVAYAPQDDEGRG
jgi:hypothetical protein